MFYIPPPPPQKFIFKLPFALQKFCPKSHSEPNCHSEPTGEESLANPNSHSEPTGDESHANPNSHSEPTGDESHANPNCHSEPTTTPRTKRVHSNSNRKILFPIMNFRFSPCLEFLPRSQSFGKGTPFQKPQSVRYPA